MSTGFPNFSSVPRLRVPTIVGMREQRSNRRERYSDTLRFGTVVDEAVERSRYSRRQLGIKIGRDGSTVASWCRGRTLPETSRDVKETAKLLGLDAKVLKALADFDKNVYETRLKTNMSESMKAAIIRGLEEELDDFLGRQKGEAAAAR